MIIYSTREPRRARGLWYIFALALLMAVIGVRAELVAEPRVYSGWKATSTADGRADREVALTLPAVQAEGP